MELASTGELILPRVRREPVFEPETAVISLSRRRVPRGLPWALGLHAAAIAAILVVPVLGDSPMPEAARGVRAFLVEPAGAPPPPPPPPAPTAARKVIPRPQPEDPNRKLTAPTVVPDDIQPEATIDLGPLPSGPSGVEGGVPGGVVGGVIGGLVESRPEPVRVGGVIKEPRKLKTVAPEYPEKARKAGIEGVVVLECLVSPAGRVQEIKVLRSIPLLDEPAVAAVKQWLYTPTLVGGVAVPILLTVTLRFGLR